MACLYRKGDFWGIRKALALQRLVKQQGFGYNEEKMRVWEIHEQTV